MAFHLYVAEGELSNVTLWNNFCDNLDMDKQKHVPRQRGEFRRSQKVVAVVDIDLVVVVAVDVVVAAVIHFDNDYDIA